MKIICLKETKIFDPAEGFGSVKDAWVITDSTVTKRGDRWWMFLAGKAAAPSIELFSASLPEGSPLAATGWKLVPKREDRSKIGELAGHGRSEAWDLKGGRHCPSYVRGWDPLAHQWVERIYYAGGSENVWGPYRIGYLEWDGEKWQDQASPVFTADEGWEHGSVYEPNLIYHDGKLRMWYVAGSNQEEYIVHGYAESEDGQTNWSGHKVFFGPEEKVFDFHVVKVDQGYEAVFSRVILGTAPPVKPAGLWWCACNKPSSAISDWSEPVQLMSAEDKGWHFGPWKPCLCYDSSQPGRMFVFFDGMYRRPGDQGPFPFVFTLGCIEIDRSSVTA